MTFANQKRGLRLADPNFTYLTEGAYGVVFVDRYAGLIRKVYRRKSDVEHAQAVFDAEVKAYELAINSEQLRSLVPSQFNVRPEQQVFDWECNDVSEEFLTNLSFEAEFIDCHFRKIGEISSSESSRISALFRGVGIQHTSDMSVCLDSNGIVVKAVDFAMREFEVWV